MNFQHGDLPRTHQDFLDPADLTPFTFDGNGTQRDAITAKDKMINALRRRGLEEFITKPLVDLLPNEEDYNTRDAKERRELAKDKNEVTEKHRKAYATVRAIIKPNSACEAIISEADFDCDVQLFFKLFEDQYLKTTSISAAFNLILMFNKQVDETGDVIQAYIKHRELVYQMEQVKQDEVPPDQRPSGFAQPRERERDTFTTPGASGGRSTPSTRASAASDSSIISRRNFLQTSFPEWIWVLTILMKLRESPKFKTIINNFLKIKLFNNNRLTIGKIKDKTIFELLKDFVRQSAQEEESKDRKSEAYHTNLEEQPSPMTTLEREARRQAEEFFNHATRIADKHRMD